MRNGQQYVEKYMRQLAHILSALSVTLLAIAPIDVTASDMVPGAKQDHPIALVGGTIHTVSGDVVNGGTILFDGGRIVAIGNNVELPAGTERIDVSGKHVYPGLISANTSMGLFEIGAVRATRDYSEVGSIKPNVRAAVAVNPDSEIIPVTRANGITMALSIPVGGLITGTSALVALDGWTWEDLAFESPVGMHINWPRMTVSSSSRQSEEEQKKRRDENLARIKDAFTDARAYLKAKEAENAKGIPYHDSDLRWDAMAPVINGEIPVFIHANGIKETQASIDWAASENLRIVIVGGYDAWRVTDLLKEHNVSVVVAGVHRLPSRRWEDYDTPFKLPERLRAAGIPFCIAGRGGSFQTPHERNLPYHAATAAAHGLPKEDALKAVTLFAAQVLGVADRVGSLDVGKDATMIVTNGDPLEIMTDVEMEFIQGRSVDLNSRHTQLYEKYKQKYKQNDDKRTAASR